MNRITNNVTLVCYDISNDKLRRKIDNCLKDYGIRLQYSVFLCRIEQTGVERLRRKLANIHSQFEKEYNPRDSLIFVEHIPECQIEFFFDKGIKLSNQEYKIF
ncbi:MAG: CRISPR-associated endonuclease Cas2 [Firmicutes bacterium HGW-Firmicutes-4]|jgi:CRISPR-associated protein Cas2|nr:MAG: CRISPR-associated endonuclease Cas2 [Firmicutes bacterium HGW-Firmicutes-4]